jgi:hypothetical protein
MDEHNHEEGKLCAHCVVGESLAIALLGEDATYETLTADRQALWVALDMMAKVVGELLYHGKFGRPGLEAFDHAAVGRHSALNEAARSKREVDATAIGEAHKAISDVERSRLESASPASRSVN